ncbi:hypothetical protein VBD025_03145 [Virgibacillus flavescens]|uniref:hypothetical protein n=1 Tax=Virgibacillus flavescens TaxID=1611422 RepID=UPI003D32D6D7
MAIVVASVFSLLLVQAKNETNIVLDKSNKNALDDIDNNSLEFADNFISYVIEEDETMSFNIFGVQNTEKGNHLDAELISFLEFNNSNIEIVDFRLDSGLTHNNYKLINIIVEVKINSDNIENAEQLVVHFKNNKEKMYDFGSLTLQNDKRFVQNDISPKGNYTVGYPTLSLDVNLRNESDQTIKMKQIDDLKKNLSYHFDNVMELNSLETTRIVVPSFEIVDEKDFDFYTVTPILHYSSGTEEYLYNMPGVLYGVLRSDIDKIKKITD